MSEKIEDEGGERDKPAPKMKGEVRVNAGETGHEMCFEGVDGFFGGVHLVVVRRGELVVDVVEF